VGRSLFTAICYDLLTIYYLHCPTRCYRWKGEATAPVWLAEAGTFALCMRNTQKR
jgi:hypothetical protein